MYKAHQRLEKILECMENIIILFFQAISYNFLNYFYVKIGKIYIYCNKACR